MTMAWGLFALIGIFSAAVLKRLKVESWFVVHMICMLATAMFTLAGYIVVLQGDGDYGGGGGGGGGFGGGGGNSNAHSIIGVVIVFGGAVFLPILGFVRPRTKEVSLAQLAIKQSNASGWNQNQRHRHLLS